MAAKKPTVAVTGLNATDNPGPGVAVIRALRHDESFEGRIVGLAYDTLDPGIYATDLVDDVFLIPYPSQGIEALEARLRYIHEQVPLDVLIPTLDAELPSFIALEDTLRSLGIGSLLPSREQYDIRSKVHLYEVGRRGGFDVPRARVLSDVDSLYKVHEEIPYPFMLKGLFYGAMMARSIDEAVAAFHRTAAQWGLPIIVQEYVDGDELNVVAVGDGEGGLVGTVGMRKTMLTDKGKGWCGVTVTDPRLQEITERFMEATKWRGPCEVEVLKSQDGEYYVVEVNPRFPAWCYLSAGAGVNLPLAVARLAAGEEPPSFEQGHRAGVMFVRISLDQIADIKDFEAMATTGEIRR